MLATRVGTSAPKPELRYAVADSLFTAPGWRLLCDDQGVTDFYTCIPPVDRPMPDVAAREIHAFDPSAIFLWRKQLYLPPGATQPVLVCHNAMGRYMPVPNRELQLFHVEMPQTGKHPRPNELLWVWERFDECLMFEGGPGAYMPWDGKIIRYLRQDHTVMSPAQEIQALLERRREEKKVRAQKDKAEIALSHADLDAWISRQLDKPGDSAQALKEYNAKRRAKKAVRPYAFLGR